MSENLSDFYSQTLKDQSYSVTTAPTELQPPALAAPPVAPQDSTDEIQLSPNALYLLKERFLHKNEKGETVETPAAMMRRVARGLAAAEPTPSGQRMWEKQFYRVMANLEFHPGSRIMANAGSPRPQLGNCFVFPLNDSQAEIFQTLTESSMIKGHGGGCGFNYSAIRPKGDVVRGTPDLAVGPVKLLKMFDLPSKMFRQQGRYESGNMAILNVDHPDVLDFIMAKQEDGTLSHTNISLGIYDSFMEAVVEDREWGLINPRTKEVVRTVRARQIFDTACDYAGRTGDPGMLFLDRINERNPLRDGLGDINAVNTCGEIGLYAYESCNLGYLNLPRFVLPEHLRTKTQIFDAARLKAVIAVGIRMIDNAISVSWSPLEKIQEVCQANRRIGLGVTGWADCLALADIAYDSEEALALAESLAQMMYEAAFEASLALGLEKGPFPNVEYSSWRGQEAQPRNVALLAFPPSGNNAVIFDTAFSIEPFFALSFNENILGGVRIKHVNRLLYQVMEQAGLPTEGLAEAIEAEQGSLQRLPWIPDSIKRRFRTAHDISPEWHVRMQASFQKYVDNAITKTVNLPSTAGSDDVARVYHLAWKLGCKGITVYRDNSRSEQTIEFTSSAISADGGSTCTVCSG
jgi:ribonucleoside-diphosphate reductase alpha chain